MSATSPAPASYPASLGFEGPQEIARWRPFVHWLLAFPQLLITQVLQMLRGVLTLIAFFTIIFTKEIPKSLYEVMAMTLRYQWRVYSYVLFMRESYPPFVFDPSTADTRDDPAWLEIEYPSELQRFMPFIKWLLAIPHLLVLFVLILASFFAVLGAVLAVLVTGRFPAGIRDYLVGVARWVLRVNAYVGLLRDEYPPFSLR